MRVVVQLVVIIIILLTALLSSEDRFSVSRARKRGATKEDAINKMCVAVVGVGIIFWLLYWEAKKLEFGNEETEKNEAICITTIV